MENMYLFTFFFRDLIKANNLSVLEGPGCDIGSKKIDSILAYIANNPKWLVHSEIYRALNTSGEQPFRWPLEVKYLHKHFDLLTSEKQMTHTCNRSLPQYKPLIKNTGLKFWPSLILWQLNNSVVANVKGEVLNIINIFLNNINRATKSFCHLSKALYVKIFNIFSFTR